MLQTMLKSSLFIILFAAVENYNQMGLMVKTAMVITFMYIKKYSEWSVHSS